MCGAEEKENGNEGKWRWRSDGAWKFRMETMDGVMGSVNVMC